MTNFSSSNLSKFINSLNDDLSKSGLQFEVAYRLKSPYSILRKLIGKSVELSKITDLIALRILVERNEDCYKIWNFLESSYKINPKYSKDYIARPKDNGYSSLHIIVANLFQTNTNQKRNVEIQVRTKEMHNIAEFGKANYSDYKKRQNILDEQFFLSLLNIPSTYTSLTRAFSIHNTFNWTLKELVDYEKEVQKVLQIYNTETR